MKRIILSGFIVISFIVYAISDRLSLSQQTISPLANNPTPNNNSSSSPSNQKTQGAYKDGNFVGDITDAFYGNVQVQAVIKNGKIVDVKFLDYPHDRQNSIFINSQATPMLTQEAIQTQSANVDIVSGATATSQAFIQSLQSALTKAQG